MAQKLPKQLSYSLSLHVVGHYNNHLITTISLLLCFFEPPAMASKYNVLYTIT